MAEQKFFDCSLCGGRHPFVPHPTKEGRIVAYCGGRGVCETNAPKPSVDELIEGLERMQVEMEEELHAAESEGEGDRFA